MKLVPILSAVLVGVAAAPAPAPGSAPLQAGQVIQSPQGIVCFFRRDEPGGAKPPATPALPAAASLAAGPG